MTILGKSFPLSFKYNREYIRFIYPRRLTFLAFKRTFHEVSICYISSCLFSRTKVRFFLIITTPEQCILNFEEPSEIGTGFPRLLLLSPITNAPKYQRKSIIENIWLDQKSPRKNISSVSNRNTTLRQTLQATLQSNYKRLSLRNICGIFTREINGHPIFYAPS
jgi:hypothetical protein